MSLRKDHRSVISIYMFTNQLDMNTFWILSLCEAAALPAICAVLRRIAKQQERSIPRWDQFLRGVFLSQVIVWAVIALVRIHGPAVWLPITATGSWCVTLWCLDHSRFGVHNSLQNVKSSKTSQEAEQTDASLDQFAYSSNRVRNLRVLRPV